MYEAKCLVMDYQPHSGTVPAAVAQPQQNHHHHQFHQLHPLAPDTSARWSQYQQLWRQHHMFINGKSCGKESPEKKEETELWSNVEAQAAFLGPNLWEKTLPYDTDLKYVDLDEFLSENGIPVEGGLQAQQPTQHPPQASSSGCIKEPGRMSPSSSTQPPVLTKREPSPSPSEAMSPLAISPPSPAESTLSFASSSRDAFDPRTRAFSDEELKPQPMVKKSRKQDSQFVPEGLKDEKYWARRRKNNMAAKRSRDARRMKENQIALRAGFLEKENLGLRQEMDRLKKENIALRDRLSKFTNEI
ncbi:hepatic leukemia factor isoform X4 [Cimex lectularius]|uniref:BZIP domain-containing protein n=1 Tax=Cimex lectularius TaxID=79782 RepID=A0A8I6RWY2_CIMLE|nr:hepatic leukemia factor isoform X4 [Cimex lectularius]